MKLLLVAMALLQSTDANAVSPEWAQRWRDDLEVVREEESSG